MRRTLTALVLFSAALFILQSVPQKMATVVQRTSAEGENIEQWVQTTLADFQVGQLDCVALEAIDDGEIALAQEGESGYCASGVFTSQIHSASILFNIVGSAWAVDMPLGTAFQMEIRVGGDGHQWGDWMRVLADEDGPGGEPLVHGNLLEVSASRYLQYRLTLATFEPDASPLVRELRYA